MMKFHIKQLTKFILIGSIFSIIFLLLNISIYFKVDQLCAYKLTPYIDNLDLLRCIERRGLKSIQLLTKFFNFKDWAYESLGETPFKYCPGERRCYAFHYVSEYQKPVELSHGIIVHVPNLVEMPSRSVYKRNPSQLWSFFSMEASRFTYCNLGKTTITDLDDWFNITQTIKSHVYLGIDFKNLHLTPQYRAAYKRDRKLIMNPISKILSKKKSLVVWFVSRCQSPNGRERYVKELSKYINVDIFGGCGTKIDPCKLTLNSSESCFIDVYNSYKFYLAFENSNCDMYITEKFFKFYQENFIFKINIVPIVMGAPIEQYKRFAPSHPSFIYANKDARSLAEYLLYLDKNNTAYMEYFTWKTTLMRKIQSKKTFGTHYKRDLYQSPLCDLCALLHNETFLKQTHKPIMISEEFNFLKDCSSNHELNPNGEISSAFNFDNLKNRCYRSYV